MYYSHTANGLKFQSNARQVERTYQSISLSCENVSDFSQLRSYRTRYEIFSNYLRYEIHVQRLMCDDINLLLIRVNVEKIAK